MTNISSRPSLAGDTLSPGRVVSPPLGSGSGDSTGDEERDPPGGPPVSAPSIGSSQHLKVLQLNVRKSKVPTYELFLKITPHSVAFIQEPWVHKGRLLGMLPTLKGIYNQSGDNSSPPRAAIVVHDTVDVIPLPQFTTNNVAAALWHSASSNPALQRIVLVSWYWHSRDPFPSVLEELFIFLEAQDLQCILCADTNAHSDVWGARSTDGRGVELEEFLTMNYVSVLNRGVTPTFDGPMGSSHIDISGVTSLLIDRSAKWECGREPSFSDHNLIRFVVRLPMRKQLVWARSLKSCNWDRYGSELDALVRELQVPTLWSVGTLDSYADILQSLIGRALNRTAPKRLVLKDKTYKWWSDELFRSRHRVRALLHQAQTHNGPDDWTAYRTQLQEYKFLIKTAKRESWQKFASNSDSIALQAKLNKVIYSEVRVSLGSVRTGTNHTKSMDETNAVLLREHFPGCQKLPSLPARPLAPSFQTVVSNLPWISPTLVRRAIRGFAKHKSPGPDEVYPECLHHLPDVAIDFLTALFKASITLSYVPAAWKLARVIFLPKAGKADYGDPRSFRPITLASFILKTLERLVQWQLESTELRLLPLHDNQYGFRKGRGTEQAISKTLATLEKLKAARRPTIAVFLDIKGAFDNVSFASLSRGLTKRGVNAAAMAWYFSLLTERITYAENLSTGTRQYIRHKRGVPQRGILSPTMWNIAFDEYISGVSGLADETTGYADDVCLLFSGDSYLDANIKARQALKFTERWSIRNNISFCPKKTEFINYLWNKEGPPIDHPLTLYGKQITEAVDFKYLGLRFNSSLTWTQHITEKVKKAKFLLKQASSAFGKIWGPSPRMIKWTLEAVVTPKVLYASHCWHAYTYKNAIKLQLRQLTRLALIQMSPCRLHTPTAGLELITHTIPLYLRAREKNVFTLMRIMDFRLDRLLTSPHLLTIHKELQSSGLSHCHLDRCPSELVSERRYVANSAPTAIPEMVWPHDTYTVPPDKQLTLSIYTDGSKINEEKSWGTGGGYVFYTKSPHQPDPGTMICSASLTICHTQTVFMAEVRAITEAARTFLKLRADKHLIAPRLIIIYTDSQAAILALTAPAINSKTVRECHLLLNEVARYSPVTLQWIKAHVGHPGNEMADSLAKRGALMPAPEIGPGPFGPTPQSFLKSVMRAYLMESWEEAWRLKEPCRQTKIWLPKPNPHKGKIMVKLKRLTLGTVTRWITGHNFLRRHQHLLDPTNYRSPTCRLCYHEDETSSHLLLNCPTLDATRLRFFRQRRPKPPFPWEVHQLVDFLEFLAEKMEDTNPVSQVLDIHVTTTSTRQILLDPLEASESSSDSVESDDPRSPAASLPALHTLPS